MFFEILTYWYRLFIYVTNMQEGNPVHLVQTIACAAANIEE